MAASERVEEGEETISPGKRSEYSPGGGSGGGWKGRLRPKTPSQFPMQLADLSQELQGANSRRDKVKRGHGLFKLVRDEDQAKKAVASEAAALEANAHKTEWKEAAVLSAASLMDLEAEGGGEMYSWKLVENGSEGGLGNSTSSTWSQAQE